MKIRSILIGALALGFAAGCARGKTGEVAGVDVPVIGAEEADGEWLQAKVGTIDREAGTVQINMTESAEEIDLQAGRDFTVQVNELPELTGLDSSPEEILQRMSEGEVINVQLTREEGELTVHRIGTDLLE